MFLVFASLFGMAVRLGLSVTAGLARRPSSEATRTPNTNEDCRTFLQRFFAVVTVSKKT